MNFSNRYFLLIAKVAIFVLMAWLIADTLFIQNDLAAQWQLFRQHFNSHRYYLFIIAMLLMPINWVLEAIKWRVLLQDERTAFTELMKGVVAGITFGLVTPARSGEFIGRVIYLDDAHKTKVFYLTGIGGIAQTAVTLMAGALCLAYMNFDSLVQGLALGLAVAVLFLYFRFDIINKLIVSFPILVKHGLTISHEELPTTQLQMQVLLISAMRYAVYLLQYVLVFMFFGVSTNALLLLVHSGLLLLVQSFSPLMPLVDISYRGGSALWVYRAVTDNNLAVLTAAVAIWLINLVVPAVVGYLFIVRKRA